MRTVGRWVGLIAAGIAISLGAQGCGGGSGHGGATSSFGHMAGYVWSGHLMSGARRRGRCRGCPGLRRGTRQHLDRRPGDRGAPRSPFIQVGTAEDRGADSVRRTRRSGPTPGAAFTRRSSSTSIPGDAVSTALTLHCGPLAGVHRRHHLRAAGHVLHPRGGRRRDSTSPSGSRRTRARRRAGPRHIPRSPTVRMHGAGGQRRAPRYGDMFAQWMSLPAR